MTRQVHSAASKRRARKPLRSSQFTFASTRPAPAKDTAAERAEKDRLVAEHLAKRHAL